MKSWIFIPVICFSCLAVPQNISAQDSSAKTDATVNIQYFYDELSPYGQWVDYPPYGYVWLPNAGPHFAPYCSSGHWIWTEYGWTWVSDYYWGWIPFHYGRWDYISVYGWIWIPGMEWGPAWVYWRSSPDYFGWAPLGPGMSIVFGPHYYISDNRWVFVERRYITHRHIHRYYRPRDENRSFINNSTIIGNTHRDERRHTVYVSGPDRAEVEKSTNAPVQQYNVKETKQPGQQVEKNNLNIYRPRVEKTTAGNSRPAPSNIVDIKTVKPAAERENTAAPLPSRQQPRPAENGQKNAPNQNYERPKAPAGEKKDIPQRERPKDNPSRQRERTPQPQPQRPQPQPQPRNNAPAKSPSRPAPPANQPRQTQPRPQTKPAPRQAPAPAPQKNEQPRVMPPKCQGT
jgi:hypothetical protein